MFLPISARLALIEIASSVMKNEVSIHFNKN